MPLILAILKRFLRQSLLAVKLGFTRQHKCSTKYVIVESNDGQTRIRSAVHRFSVLIQSIHTAVKMLLVPEWKHVGAVVPNCLHCQHCYLPAYLTAALQILLELQERCRLHDGVFTLTTEISRSGIDTSCRSPDLTSSLA